MTKSFTGCMLTRRARLTFVLLALCGVLGAITTPRFAHALPVARLLNVQPTVQVRARNTQQFASVRERHRLEYGDMVRTGKGAKARMLFVNGTVLTMSENSQIQVEAPASRNSPLVIRVFGALSAVFVRPKGNTQVRTAAAIAAARGTAFLLQLPTEDTTVVTVTEDIVDFYNTQGSVTVNAGQQSTARIGSAPTPPVVVDVTGLVAWTADISGLPVEFETPFVSPDQKVVLPLQGQQTAAVQLKPDDAKVRGRLGEVLYDLGEYSSAAAEYSRAVELSPQDAGLHYGLGQARRGQGNLPGAIAAYSRAIELAPNETAPRIGLALAHLAGAENESAAAALQPVQNAPLAQAVMGLLALRQGNTEAAVLQLRGALNADPGLYQAQALLALALLQQHQIPVALQAAQAAAKLQPNSAQAQGTLSMVLFFAGQTQEATRAAQRATELNPLSPFALITQGRILLSQLRTDEARDALQQAQALAPNLPLVHTELGTVYVRLDMLPRAEQTYRSALELDPQSADAMTGLGAVLYRQGKTDEAIAQHEAAIAADPRNATAFSNLAELYIREGRLEQARVLLDQGALAQPERGILYARLSEISLMRQDLHNAQEFARRAVSLLPSSAVAHYQLGRVYLEQGRTAQAEQQFRQAVTLDRNFAEARYALGLTREMVETGRDASRPSALPNPNRIGSAASAINLQNLQTPGAEERIQAAIQDPTVVRTASRSYGDSQIDGLIGEDDTRQLSFSHLRATSNQRGVRGLTAEHRENGGVRPNADTENQRLSIVLGQKAHNNPSGLFFLGQYDRIERGLNRGNLGIFSAGARENIRKPLFILGGNLSSGARQRTRFSLQYIEPQIDVRGLLNNSRSDTNIRSTGLELRHDTQFGQRHFVSVGAAVGDGRRESDFFFGGLPGIIPDQRFLSGTEIRITNAYVRDEVKVSDRLTLTGDLRVRKTKVQSTFQPLLPILSPVTTTTQADGTSVLPSIIAEYQLSPQSGVRFRGRRFIGSIRDFQLLEPTDVFTLTFNELPQPTLTGGSGRSYELEYDYTFRNASFLRVGIFDQDLKNARDLSVDGSGALIRKVRLRGIQAGYEGLLTRDTTFYSNVNLSRARDLVLNQNIANVPRWSAEAGLQYLNRRGWFVQPSIFYQDDRVRVNRSRAGGFGLLNLRAGKRAGLRSVAFVEIVNLLDKQHDVLEIQQPGRQLRLGILRRF